MTFLNNGTGYKLFQEETAKRAYIDKSMLVDAVYEYSQKVRKYIAVTRPQRFGKTVAANMIAAFFDASTKQESRALFEKLEVGQLRTTEGCWSYQGTEKVIRINLVEILTPEITSYQDFYRLLKNTLLTDLQREYPELDIRNEEQLPSALEKTGDRFIFIIDEWDAIFETNFITESEKMEYILLLRSLLKDRWYVHFVYLTGILPIAKYSSASPLNMFMEFTALQDEIMFPYFGMTQDEIRKIMKEKGYIRPSMDELSFWYDGYVSGNGIHMYNPNSVSLALASGHCRSYWTETGPMNEVRDIIQNNVQDLREDIIRMICGESIEIDLRGFDVEKNRVNTREEILSAMVVYGFLTYHDKKLSIPNHELVLKFQEALASKPLGLNQTLMESEKLVKATLDRKTKEVARLLEELHDEKIPFFHYNDENSLACVVLVGYLSALDIYHIEREDKAGKGYVDFSFTPMRKTDLPIILELKYNHSAKNALQCIHKKDYIQKYRGYERVLLVGVNYSERTKKHTCLMELVEVKDIFEV